MRIKFKQAVHLDGKDYPRGVHEVPEKATKCRAFHQLITAGYIVDASGEISPDSPDVRQAKLAERFSSPRKSAVPQSPVIDPSPSVGPPAGADVAQAPSAPVSEDPAGEVPDAPQVEEAAADEAAAEMVEEEGDEPAGEEEAPSKKHKKKKR